MATLPSVFDVVQVPASSSAARTGPLASVVSGHLDDGDTLATGLQRVTVELLQDSLRDLCGGDAPLENAVAHTLGAIEGVRAALDLALPEIGEEVHQSELAVLDAAAQHLRPVHDAARLVARIDEISARFASVLQADAFGELRAGLVERTDTARSELLGDRIGFEHTVHALRRAQARYLAWPTTDDDLAAAYRRRTVTHAFATVEPGLAASYRAGRKARRAVASGEAERLDEWRAVASVLAHQLAILRPLWPEVLDAMASSVRGLTERLDEHHDLVVLEAELQRRPIDPVAATALAALTTHRRNELRRDADAAGARVYHEPTRRFLERLAAYWDAWSALR